MLCLIFLILLKPYPIQEAVAMIKPIEDAEEAAKRLMQEAYHRGSADNITCVVVRFSMNKDVPSQGSSEVVH